MSLDFLAFAFMVLTPLVYGSFNYRDGLDCVS